MIKILYEDNHLLVVIKPVNLPVMADQSHDPDLLSLLKQDLKERWNKPGNVYLGLVHRLDRPVGGVMVFAKTSKAAARLSRQVQEHDFVKVYQAVVCGKADESGILQDRLIKDPRTNMVRITHGTAGKEATLSFQRLAYQNDLSLIQIHLKTGRSHQIRVQFSARQLPLWGDQRYNPAARPGQQIALWATSLTLTHPITQQRLTFSSELPQGRPWSLFKKEG